MIFIKLKDRKSLVRLDNVKVINTFFEKNLYVIRFYFIESGHFDWSFHNESEMIKSLNEINTLIVKYGNIEIIEI